jgi:predicted transcriptional regulator
MAKSTSIKLPDGLKERVRAIAEDEERSSNWVMTDAIARHVEYKEERKALREKLRAAHEDYQRTGLHLTQEEVEEWMAKRANGDRAPMPEPHT